MSASDNSLLPQSDDAYGAPSGADPVIGAREIVGALRRGWWLPVVGCLIGLAAGVYYFIAVPALYKSSARVLLDRSVSRYLQTKQIIDAPIFDDPEIGSQVYVLSSDSVIVPVVRSMKLAYDSEFVGPPKNNDNYIDQIKEFIKQAIGWDTAIDPDTVRERTAVETVIRRLTISREDVANVVTVSFESVDSNKAATIANAIAETYIATSVESKLQSTKMVGDWLRERLTELKVQATDADRALQDYKIAHNLVETGRGLLNSDQLSTLSLQLSNAQVSLAEAKARLDHIQQMSQKMTAGVTTTAVIDALSNQLSSRSSAISFAMNNSDLVRLRVLYRDLATRAAEIESRVGREHVAAIKLHERLDEVRASIREEEQRIADAYAHEYAMAKARESELAANFAEALEKSETNSQAQVTMRELESSAETLRTLYNSFLQKFKEMNTNQTQTIPVQSARIVTRAAPQLHKNSRKGLMVLGGSIMMGLFLGVGAAVGREWLANVFRTSRAVEQATNIHSVILPMIQVKQETAWFRRTKGKSIEEFVLDSPYSRFTEALRNVKAAIDSAPATNGAKVIGVVSSVSKEGKTTVAANLAALLISSSDARTLIVDADLHRRLLTATLAPNARVGLIEALDDPSRLATFVCKKERSGLDVLPCALSDRVSNAAELLGSPKMEQLLMAARGAYDYIIIEIAPIMSVVDIKMIERFMDGFIFVVEWGQTKQSVVLEAFAEAPMIRERVISIILNKADPVALRSIEAYKGDRFRDYYQE